MYTVSGSAVAQLTSLVQRLPESGLDLDSLPGSIAGADSCNSAFGLAENRWEILGESLLCFWNSPP